MIHARGLKRSFKTKEGVVEAVRGLDLDVAEGELVAFLGPNGAGKSTSVRMLTTLLPPTEGAASVAGHDVLRDANAVRRRIGYVGQGAGAGGYNKLCDELLTQGAAQRMSKTDSARRADELIGMLELTGLEKRTGMSLSGGQKRRVDIALGLMHSPKVLFLDEPSTGLDPHSRANLWEHILKLKKSTGMTIFLTTHYLDEADQMAERVMIMDNGLVIANDTPERLKANLAGDRITIDADNAELAAELAANLPEAREISRDGARVGVTVKGGEAVLPEFIRALDQRGARVLAANVRRPTLDDVFLGLTGRSLRETAA
ncbi:ATP-binding cassette domain-containing protein [Devosia sp. Root105]|uniref:ATP-binding cassette domain-containing protein n=1 Tax=Devosia sp. Root105 TaxID=1736423 RepID=UPI0006FBA054|nr:ATP-binding cassette domain-containing protein [Devosia sp. Root105]KQV09218.1 ABC transporter [Devosia sp. Root105]